MKLIIKKDEFFEILKLFPDLERAYADDFYQKYAEKKEGQNKLKIVLKKNEFLPSRVIVGVTYKSDFFEVEYEPNGLVKYKFIDLLRKKGC